MKIIWKNLKNVSTILLVSSKIDRTKFTVDTYCVKLDHSLKKKIYTTITRNCKTNICKCSGNLLF